MIGLSDVQEVLAQGAIQIIWLIPPSFLRPVTVG